MNLKKLVWSKPTLSKLKHGDLYQRLLLHYREDIYQIKIILRIVVFERLLAIDTSECERIFSLMNDIKTSTRQTLGTTKLNHLIMWKRCFGEMSSAEFDEYAYAIVERWHSISKGTKNETLPSQKTQN
eukprot:Lithocolla_globosa_v1_NODE_1841_length_2301_cov_3.286732.p2 type:complete len:128 gc:universal NODE_1841_length_2301_cov_3.286732:1800-2183(+)